MGKSVKKQGSKHLSTKQVISICEELNKGASVGDLAKKYNVTYAAIYGIVRGYIHTSIAEKHLISTPGLKMHKNRKVSYKKELKKGQNYKFCLETLLEVLQS